MSANNVSESLVRSARQLLRTIDRKRVPAALARAANVPLGEASQAVVVAEQLGKVALSRGITFDEALATGRRILQRGA